MATPYGPKPISSKGQLALPLELLRAVGLEVGDQVYVMTSDETPGGLLVVPIETVDRWTEAGRKSLGAVEAET